MSENPSTQPELSPTSELVLTPEEQAKLARLLTTPPIIKPALARAMAEAEALWVPPSSPSEPGAGARVRASISPSLTRRRRS